MKESSKGGMLGGIVEGIFGTNSREVEEVGVSIGFRREKGALGAKKEKKPSRRLYTLNGTFRSCEDYFQSPSESGARSLGY